MTRNEKIDQIIFDKGILYGECNLETIRGSYRKNQYGKIIILNSQLSPRQKFETKIHELMHDEHTTFDVSSSPAEIMRIEEGRIKRWEIEYLMPVDTLIEAFQQGYTTPLDLADFLEITPEKLAEGIGLYYQIYGPQSIHGQYVVMWNPFNIKRDRRRRK